MEVYFDDFKVEHVKSPVVQNQEYYPFGAEFNNYSRESSLKNQYRFNGGNELQDELDLNVLMAELRTYDAWGRLSWWQIDPKVDNFYDLSPSVSTIPYDSTIQKVIARHVQWLNGSTMQRRMEK